MRKAEGFDAQADRLLDEANCRCVQWWVLVMRSTSCDVAVKSGAQDLREAQARPVVRLTPAFFDAVCQPPLCGKDEMTYRALLQLHPVDLKRVVKGWLPRNGPKAGLPVSTLQQIVAPESGSFFSPGWPRVPFLCRQRQGCEEGCRSLSQVGGG